jgi:hypothetical protein
VTTPMVVPWPPQSGLEAAARVSFEPVDRAALDFSQPFGEAALVSPHSVSWRVFKNLLSLFFRGVTAVIVELAEPRVRTGVWDHTNFRGEPIRRLRCTGLAAHGDNLRCPQRGRGHDSPRSAYARHSRRHDIVGRSLLRQ